MGQVENPDVWKDRMEILRMEGLVAGSRLPELNDFENLQMA